MKKVAFITLVDPSGISGQNTYSKEVALALAKQENVNLHLFCPRPQRDLDPTLRDYVESITYISEKQPGSLCWHIKSKPELLRLFLSEHKKHDFDGIVSPLKSSSFLPPLFSKSLDIPYVLVVEGLLTENIRQQKPFPGATIASDFIAYLNVNTSRQVFVAYEEAREWLCKLPQTNPNKIETFHHGVNINQFYPRGKKESKSRIEEELPTADLLVGYVGSFKKYHRVDLLIESIAQLQVNGIDCKALLVGDGPQKALIERKANDFDIEHSLIFTGYVPHRNVPDYICTCDVMYGFIDPDAWGSPMKVYEYLACGRPVITDDSEEFSIVKKKALGKQMSDPSVYELYTNLIYFINEGDKKLEETGKRAREFILEEQTWNDLGQQINTHL